MFIGNHGHLLPDHSLSARMEAEQDRKIPQTEQMDLSHSRGTADLRVKSNSVSPCFTMFHLSTNKYGRNPLGPDVKLSSKLRRQMKRKDRVRRVLILEFLWNKMEWFGCLPRKIGYFWVEFNLCIKCIIWIICEESEYIFHCTICTMSYNVINVTLVNSHILPSSPVQGAGNEAQNAKVWPKKMSLTPIWRPRGLLWEMIRKWCGNGTGQDQTYRHILETWNYWNFSNTLTGYLPCHLVLKYLCNSLHIFASGIATQPGNQLLYHQFVACGAEPVQDRHDMVSGIIRNP